MMEDSPWSQSCIAKFVISLSLSLSLFLVPPLSCITQFHVVLLSTHHLPFITRLTTFHSPEFLPSNVSSLLVLISVSSLSLKSPLGLPLPQLTHPIAPSFTPETFSTPPLAPSTSSLIAYYRGRQDSNLQSGVKKKPLSHSPNSLMDQSHFKISDFLLRQ